MLKKIFYAVIFLMMLLMGIYFVYNDPEMRSSISELVNQTTDKKSTVQEKKAQKTELSKADIVKLTKENMQTFALSVKKKDMSGFYNNISDYWQKRTSVKNLNKDFGTFIKQGLDLTTLNPMQPILDKGTKIDERGDLYVVGHYNTKPLTLHFQQIYKFKHPDGWKLVAFSVEIK